jgi:hypothetical protein
LKGRGVEQDFGGGAAIFSSLVRFALEHDPSHL